MLGKTALAVLLFSVFRLTPAVQQGGSHSAAAGHQIKAFLVDTPLEQHTAVERHQLGHQLLPVPLGGDAAFLLAGGTPGKRLALPHSTIMIHQPSGGAQGQATEIQIVADRIQYTKRMLNELLAANTHQPLEKIAADTERDYYMSAEEAKNYGLIDAVVTKRA